MLILLGFSFLAGIVTILSPCILPVLPIVLSGSIGGGKRRPIGVVVGFVLSFTLFTLFLTSLVRAIGISPSVLRSVSIILIFLFGLSLLLPGFQKTLERLFAKLSGFAPMKKGSPGFWGGFLVGLSIGLIWTPCVGPILGSVISLALTGTVTGTAFLITLAYSSGTAIPMLGITYGGRELLERVPWLTKNTGKIQKIFGIIMMLTSIGIFFNVDRTFQAYILERFPQYGTGLTQFEDNEFVEERLDVLESNGGFEKEDMGKPMSDFLENMGKAPELIQGGVWFNSEPLKLSGLKGEVVLVDFWTYTCINCIRTLPYLRDWHGSYADDGLVIIGVHTPEFEFEKDAGNLKEAIEDFGLEYPIMQDNDYATWRAYENRYWPAKYLIDKDGNIRYTHFGEGAYDETERNIQRLLNEAGAYVGEDIDNPEYSVESRTPEIYLGYKRIQYYQTPEQLVLDEAKEYQAGEGLARNRFSFDGEWVIGEEYAMPHEGAELNLDFEAKEVFLVMRAEEGGEGTVRVFLDDEPVSEYGGGEVEDGVVAVSSDRLYELVKLDTSGHHRLKLEFLDANLQLFAFTFG